MGQYLLRRVLIAIPSLLGISAILFIVLALAPGDPFGELATNPNVPPEVRMALREKFGLDDPVFVRYWRWLVAMLRGDWGFSFVSRIDVDVLILQRVKATLLIIGIAQLLALAIALPVGVYAARRPYSVFDQIANTLAFVGFSLPTFFTGLVLILVFSIWLDWLPFVYRSDLSETGWQWYWVQFKQSIMPIMVLASFQAASMTRYVRSAVLDVIRRQGSRRAHRHLPTCRAQRPHSRCDVGGIADAELVRWRHRDRADLPHSGHRLAADLIHSRQ
jgi:peptide/nickel transport system permease protein